MSNANKDAARKANGFLRSAKDYAREAKEIFKKIGDSEGERHAAASEKAADDGSKHVEKVLGGPKNN